MSKILIIIVVIAVLGVGGFFAFDKNGIQDQAVNTPTATSIASPAQQTTKPTILLTTEPSQSAEPLSPIFSYLPKWVPAATWSTPQKSTYDSPYGKITGMEATGKITGKGTFKGRNFEDLDVMYNLGFKIEDIKFAADGPGASNWGYTQTENGKSWIVILSYSTNALLGPENTSPPYANISVFVSDSFTINK